MKIAIVTETFLPSTDGVAIRFSFAVDEMLRQGNEVIIICPEVEGVQDSYKKAKIYAIPAVRFFFYKQRKWGVPHSKIGKALDEFQPDIIHAVNPISLASSAVRYAKRNRIPLVCSYHTNVPKYLDHYGFGFLKPILWAYLRRLHNTSPINLVTSKATYELLEKHKIRGLRVLPKAVDSKNRSPEFYSDEMRKKLSGGETDKTLLVYVGRLAPEKEVHSLKKLIDSRDDIRLAIVGGGPSQEELQETFAGTDTVFTGFLKGRPLSEAYASADIFIFPSQSETLGLVLAEAMASGTPVIAVESEPTNEQITHRKNGLLYRRDSFDSLMQCIDALKDKTLHAKIKQAGIKYASQFTWEKSSQVIIDAYKETLENQKSSHKQS